MQVKFLLIRFFLIFIFGFLLGYSVMAQPSNDDCAQATVLPVSATGLPVFTASATQSATASMAGCTGTATADVWFTFTALQSTQYIYLQHNGFGPTNSIIQVFSGTCGALTSVTCNGGIISHNFPNTSVMAQTALVPGQTYLIRVYYNNTTTTAFSIGVANGAPNNECADAVHLTVSPDANSVFTPGTTFGATASTPNNSCIFSSSNDVWYSFTATAATHAIDMLQLNNPRLQIFTGTCVNLTAIPCNFFYQTIGDTSRVTVSGLTPGTTYRVKVFSNNFNANNRFQIAVQTPFVAPNDVCSNAAILPVSGNSCAPQRISFRGAVPDDVSHPSCVWTGGQDQDIWYAITPANSRLKVKFSQADGLTTWTKRMALYSGACNNLTPVVCGVSDSFSISGLTTGATYYLRVSKSGGDLRDSIGELCAFVPDAAPYDECINAAVLPVGNTHTISYSMFTTTNASYSLGITPALAPSVTGNRNDIFLKFTATSTTSYIGFSPATTGGFDYAIFTGNCSALVIVSAPSLLSADFKLPLSTVVGQDYFIWLSSNANVYVRVGVSSTVDAPNKICTNAVPVTVGANSERALPYKVQFGSSGLSRPSCPVGYTHETWFSFQAPSDSLGILLAAQSQIFGWEILSGGCNALVSVKCGTVTAATTWTPSVINGLNTGTHYLLRILSNGFVTESRQPLLYLYNAKKAGNNYCTQAVTLAVQPASGYQLTAGSTAGNYNEVNNCTTTGEAWYTFTATAAAHTLVLKGNLSPRLSLYTGQCGSLSLVSGTCLTASQSGREVRSLINLTPGTTYFIRVAGTGNFANSGAFEIAVTQNSVPGNDDCSNPVLLPVQQLQDAKANQYFTTRGSTASAPGSVPASACAASFSGDVWFGFTGNGKQLSVETEVLNNNFLVYLYSGSCGGFTELACGENAGILNLASQNGANYRLRVVPRFSGTQIEFRVRVFETPALLSNPIVQTDCLGANLVLNPGLDNLNPSSCPTSFVTQPSFGTPRFDLLAASSWSMANYATTDIFSTCGGLNTSINPVFNTCSGNQSPRSGTNYAGIFAHNVNRDYQEYLQGQFAQPLTPGKTYLFSFNISLADYSLLAIDRLGVYFSQNPVRVPVDGAIGLTPQYETPAGQFFTDKNGWTTISFLYTPTEAAAYFVIGNFRHFTETNTMGALENGGRNAGGAFSGCTTQDVKPTVYYFIDDVSLAEVTGNGCLLPIDDLTWRAQPQEQDVRIGWEKQQEENVAVYRIEHSTDGRRFETIGSVMASGKRQYDYLHKNLQDGRHYYRIAVENREGKIERTGIKMVTVGKVTTPIIWPTVTQGTVWVKNVGSLASVTIVNSLGQAVTTQKVNDAAAIELGRYAKGMYWVVVVKKDGSRFTEKIVLQ